MEDPTTRSILSNEATYARSDVNRSLIDPDENTPLNHESHNYGTSDRVLGPITEDPQESIVPQYKRFIHNSKIGLNILIFLNTLWLVVAFVSDYFFAFVWRNRLVGYIDINLLFLAVITNILSLWFNRAGLYSQWDQMLNFTNGCLVLFNFLLLQIPSYSRDRVSSIPYLWCAFSLFFGSLLDYILLQFNKKMYNEANRHTLSEWAAIGFRNTVKVVILVYITLITCNTALFTIDLVKSSPADSTLIWANDLRTFKVYLQCYGDVHEGTQPIVLFESGGYDTSFTSATWIQELYHLGTIERYCVWNRPGYGWSDSAPSPISMAMVADSLTFALNSKNITGPFSVVGYDYGGLQAQVFASKNIDKVDGLLLVESWHENLLLKNYLERILPGNGNAYDPNDTTALPAEVRRHNALNTWFSGIVSPASLWLQSSWMFAHHGSLERIVGRDMQYQGKFLRAKLQEDITGSVLSYNDVLQSREHLQKLKLSVVSSSEMIKKSAQWGNWQREITKLSASTLEWKIVQGAHEVFKYGISKGELQDVLLRLVVGSKAPYTEEHDVSSL